jgi:murein DD-endopeptidase MepM/ murein hydrolase activator NlpD
MKQIVLLPFILLVAVFSGRAGNVTEGLSDTIAPHLTNITDERTIRLLSSDPVYKEYWFNDMTFTYDSVRVTDLPEVSVILINYSGDKFTPTWYGKLSSAYQWRWGRQHHGVDLGLKTGNPIYAAWDGIVRYAQWNTSGYGNCVVIRHKSGLETLYGHMSKLMVTPNQFVSSGDMIGLGGSTGRSTGPHLHFEIRYKDFSINPEHIIDYQTLRLRVDTFHFFRSSISGTRYGGDINAGFLKISPVEYNDISVHSDDSIGSSALFSDSDSLYSDIDAQTASIIRFTSTVSPVTPSDVGRSSSIASQKKTSVVKGKSVVKSNRKKLPTTYVIKKGDTYTSIAEKNVLSISTLKRLNPKLDEHKLRPGRKIRIR